MKLIDDVRSGWSLYYSLHSISCYFCDEWRHQRLITHENGPDDCECYFFRSLDIWLSLSFLGHEEFPYFWLMAGTGGAPVDEARDITIQFNHQSNRRDRRLGGRWIQNGSNFRIGHTGRVARLSLRDFDAFPVVDTSPDGSHLVFSQEVERSRDFLVNVADFVHRVRNFKDTHRSKRV